MTGDIFLSVDLDLSEELFLVDHGWFLVLDEFV